MRAILFLIITTITIKSFGQESLNPFNLSAGDNFFFEVPEELVKKNKLKSYKIQTNNKTFKQGSFNIEGQPLNINYFNKRKKLSYSIFSYDTLNRLQNSKSFQLKTKYVNQKEIIIRNKFDSIGILKEQLKSEIEKYSWRSKSKYFNKNTFVYNLKKDSLTKNISVYTSNGGYSDTTILEINDSYQSYFFNKTIKKIISDTIILDTIKSNHSLLLGGGCISWASPDDPVIELKFVNKKLIQKTYYKKDKKVNERKYIYLINGLLHSITLFDENKIELSKIIYVYDYY